jgi:hypothetical protein
MSGTTEKGGIMEELEKLINKLEELVDLTKDQKGFIAADTSFGTSTLHLSEAKFKETFKGQKVLCKEMDTHTNELYIMIGQIKVIALEDRPGFYSKIQEVVI